MDLTIGGIALVPIIAGILELLKRAGLDVKYVPWLNIVLSVLAYTAIQLLVVKPELLQPAVIIINGIVVALAAAGVYSTTRYYKAEFKAMKLNAEIAESAEK